MYIHRRMTEEKKSVVWVQVVSTEWENFGEVVKIKFAADDDVNDLREAVKAKLNPRLNHAAENELKVFPANTTHEEFKAGAKALDPGEAVDTLDVTTSKRPLVVVAPSASSQGMCVLCALRAVTDNCRHHLYAVLCHTLLPPSHSLPPCIIIPARSLDRSLDRSLAQSLAQSLDEFSCPGPSTNATKTCAITCAAIIQIFFSYIVFSALPLPTLPSQNFGYRLFS